MPITPINIDREKFLRENISRYSELFPEAEEDSRGILSTLADMGSAALDLESDKTFAESDIAKPFYEGAKSNVSLGLLEDKDYKTEGPFERAAYGAGYLAGEVPAWLLGVGAAKRGGQILKGAKNAPALVKALGEALSKGKTATRLAAATGLGTARQAVSEARDLGNVPLTEFAGELAGVEALKDLSTPQRIALAGAEELGLGALAEGLASGLKSFRKKPPTSVATESVHRPTLEQPLQIASREAPLLPPPSTIMAGPSSKAIELPDTLEGVMADVLDPSKPFSFSKKRLSKNRPSISSGQTRSSREISRELFDDISGGVKKTLSSERGAIGNLGDLSPEDVLRIKRIRQNGKELIERAKITAARSGDDLKTALKKLGVDDDLIPYIGLSADDLISRPKASTVSEVIGSVPKEPNIRPVQTEEWMSSVKDIDPVLGKSFSRPEDVILAATGESREKAFSSPLYKKTFKRVKEMIPQRNDWIQKNRDKIKSFVEAEGYDVLDSNQAEQITDLMNRASGAELDKLSPNQIASKYGADQKVAAATKKFRTFMNDLRDEANVSRKANNQPLIGYIDNYVPYIQERSIIGDLFKSGDISPQELADHLHAKQRVNPRAISRSANAAEFAREKNIYKIMDNYIESMAHDVHTTPAIQDVNSVASALTEKGYYTLPKYLQHFVDRNLAGKFGPLESKSRRLRNAAHLINRARAIGALTFNLPWMAITQPSSAMLTIGETGLKNSMKGAYKFFTDPSFNKMIKSLPTMKIKRAGSMIDKMSGEAAHSGRIFTTKRDVVNDVLSAPSNFLEQQLQGMSIAAGMEQGAKMGLKGEELKDFAEYVGSITQSSYNREFRPTALNDAIVRALSPFQTFSFEMMNHAARNLGLRDTAKYADSALRIKQITTAMVAMGLYDYMAQSTVGRELYTAGSFIPFIGQWFDQMVQPIQNQILADVTGDDTFLDEKSGTTAAPMAPLEDAKLIADGFSNFYKSGDTKKLRKALIFWGMGLGGIGGATQVNRAVDTIMANSKGYVQSTTGRVQFPMSDEPLEQVKSFIGGPWMTKAGREQAERGFTPLGEKQSLVFDLLQKRDPKQAKRFYEQTMMKRDIMRPIQKKRRELIQESYKTLRRK